MKLNILLILLLFTSCVTVQERHIITKEESTKSVPKFKLRDEKFEDCAERFLKLGLKPDELMEVCKEAHK